MEKKQQKKTSSEIACFSKQFEFPTNRIPKLLSSWL